MEGKEEVLQVLLVPGQDVFLSSVEETEKEGTRGGEGSLRKGSEWANSYWSTVLSGSLQAVKESIISGAARWEPCKTEREGRIFKCVVENQRRVSYLFSIRRSEVEVHCKGGIQRNAD